MLSFVALSVGTKAFGNEDVAVAAEAEAAPVAVAVAQEYEAAAVEPVTFSLASVEESEGEAAEPFFVAENVAVDAVEAIEEPVATEPVVVAEAYTPAPVPTPVAAAPSSTIVIAQSEPMSHEIAAFAKIQEQHDAANAIRDEQYNFMMAREAGMYFEPRIFGANQTQDVEIAEQSSKSKAAKTSSSSSAADSGKDKRYGSGAGIKAGMVISQFDMNYKGAPMQVGFTGGIFAKHIFKNNIGLGAEVNFTQISARTYYNENSFTGAFNEIETTSLNYVNVPLLLSYNKLFVEGLAVEAGIQLGFLVGGKVKTEYPAYDSSANLPTDYNTFDLAIPFGVSYMFKNGITFGARYALGLSTTLESKSYKNRSATITAGYRF